MQTYGQQVESALRFAARDSGRPVMLRSIPGGGECGDRVIVLAMPDGGPDGEQTVYHDGMGRVCGRSAIRVGMVGA